jgi:hypothetical protein
LTFPAVALHRSAGSLPALLTLPSQTPKNSQLQQQVPRRSPS